MIRVLCYIIAFLLIGICFTSGGWYLCCNRPCDPEYVMVKGDTVYIKPEPIAIIPPGNIPISEKPQKGVFSLFKKQSPDTLYKVRQGDNLYRIGLKYGLSAEELRLANKLSTYDIKRGQWLAIPKRTIQDSVYTYHKEFGDSVVRGEVWTQSTGQILSQSVSWSVKLPAKKTRYYLGGSTDGLGLSGFGAVQLKSGLMITGQAGLNGTYQVGILKQIR